MPPQEAATHAGTAGEVFDILGAETAGSMILGSAPLEASFPPATVLLVAMSAGALFQGSGAGMPSRRRAALLEGVLARRRALDGIRVVKCFSRKELKLFTLPVVNVIFSFTTLSWTFRFLVRFSYSEEELIAGLRTTGETAR